MKREPPLVQVLPRQPGTKEARYAQLLSGDAERCEPEPVAGAATAVHSNPVDEKRMALLEDKVAGLQQELASLKQLLADFRKQFE
jgi:uncharacterized protein YceH (UPF0502 family)